jgi:hypothetical protein
MKPLRILAVALLLPLSSHAGLRDLFEILPIGTDTAQWTEEVLQPDGSVIQVWREARAHSHGFPNSRRGSDIDYKLKYEPLGIFWSGPVLSEPVSFEIFEGRAYLTLLTPRHKVCADRPPEALAATILKWVAGVWVEVPQEVAPIGLMHKNLYTGYWGHSTTDDAKGLVSIRVKKTEDGADAYLPLTEAFKRAMALCKNVMNRGDKK